jgi:hypothetical protein
VSRPADCYKGGDVVGVSRGIVIMGRRLASSPDSDPVA